MMPRSKPISWPKYMREKRLANGTIAFYWAPPSWAKKRGCPVRGEALGLDYGLAKKRCDEVLNIQFHEWRVVGEGAIELAQPQRGTFDWMVTVYKASPQYGSLTPKTRKDYDAALAIVSKYELKDRRRFGSLSLKSVLPGTADKLFDKLKEHPKGGQRVRTALYAMQVCRRAWTVAARSYPSQVPNVNPFTKMGIKYQPKPTRAITIDELFRFVAAADRGGEPSIGNAALIAYFWLQRQEDILNRLSWTKYRPAEAPDTVQVFHFKTGVPMALPLVDDDGTDLWPELTKRLDAAPKRGTLIITRDKLDRRRKTYLPWTPRYFRARVQKIREAAGIDADAKFMGLRHGGNTEAADADLTDAQIRALSGHKTTEMVALYAKPTMRQRKIGARKRLETRTKRGQMSE